MMGRIKIRGQLLEGKRWEILYVPQDESRLALGVAIK